MKAPIVEVHDSIHVVRDDLFPGGTKARFVAQLFDDADEVVYASPCEGGAQYALAVVARQLGKRATIFCAKRTRPHSRSLSVKAAGGKVLQVGPAGYLSVVQARARAYAEARGALLAPFGMNLPGTIDAIAQAALSTDLKPSEVWCASGSGVLARALGVAFPSALINAVQVGRRLSASDVRDAKVHAYPLPFGKPCPTLPPFPSDPHYDAKAWQTCKARRGAGLVLFWNVLGGFD